MGEVYHTYHVFLNFLPKPLDILRRSISQRLSNIPPRALAQLTLTLALFLLARCKCALALTLDRLAHIPHRALVLDQRARRLRLEPAREDVPPRRARSHLEPEVARPINELEHRVRRVVARAVAKLVHARVAALAMCVARRERVEYFGCERGLQEEARGFLPGWMRALFS